MISELKGQMDRKEAVLNGYKARLIPGKRNQCHSNTTPTEFPT